MALGITLAELRRSGASGVTNSQPTNMNIAMPTSDRIVFGVLNAFGVSAFGRAEIILTFGMWTTLMVFGVLGLLPLLC